MYPRMHDGEIPTLEDMLNAFNDFSISPDVVDSRCSAEYITPTFLPCILIGLNNAPHITKYENGLNVDILDFLTVPYNALGGIPVFEMGKRNKKIYAIKENKTVLDVTLEKLPLECDIINMYEDLSELI